MTRRPTARTTASLFSARWAAELHHQRAGSEFRSHGLTLLQPDELRNDVTIIGELEPVTMSATTSLATAPRWAFIFRRRRSARRGHRLRGGLLCHRSNPHCGASPIPTEGLGQRRPASDQRRSCDRQLRRTTGTGGGLMMQHGQFIFSQPHLAPWRHLQRALADPTASPVSICPAEATVTFRHSSTALYGPCTQHHARTSIRFRDPAVLQRRHTAFIRRTCRRLIPPATAAAEIPSAAPCGSCSRFTMSTPAIPPRWPHPPPCCTTACCPRLPVSPPTR